MGTYSKLYVGAYILVSPSEVEDFQTVVNCSPGCGMGQRHQKFCPECGHPVILEKISQGTKIQINDIVPDEFCNDFYPARPDEPLSIPGSVAWISNKRNCAYVIPEERAAEITAADIQRCASELQSSVSFQLVSRYFDENNVQYKIAFGALLHYV